MQENILGYLTLVGLGWLGGLTIASVALIHEGPGPDIVVGKSSDSVGNLLAVKPDSAQPVYHIVVNNGCIDATRIGDHWPSPRRECE